MSSNVLKLEDILDKQSGESKNDDIPVNSSTKKKKLILPRGEPKSGRPWKTEKKRFKSIIKTRGIKVANSFEKQMKLRDDLKRIKTITRAREEERKEEKEQKKERRRNNIEKQKKNALKSEIVQVIRNPAKIKKMRKKQLRSIEKRDTTVISK